MQVGWVKVGEFQQIARYIPKTVQDKRTLKLNRKSYALYRMMTDIADDLGWPVTNPFSTFCIAFRIFVTAAPRDFKLGILWDLEFLMWDFRFEYMWELDFE